MPLPFRRRNKDESVSPEIEFDSARRSTGWTQPNAETARNLGLTSDPELRKKPSFISKEVDDNQEPVSYGEVPDSAVQTEASDMETLVRPKTPPQGSNHSPWTSYHDLSPSHPVFAYPVEKREKLYAKGIDPVLQAQFDLGHFGTVHGEAPSKSAKRHVKQFFSQLGNGNSGGTSASGWGGSVGTS